MFGVILTCLNYILVLMCIYVVCGSWYYLVDFFLYLRRLIKTDGDYSDPVLNSYKYELENFFFVLAFWPVLLYKRVPEKLRGA